MGYYTDQCKMYGRKPDSRFSGHSPGFREEKEGEEEVTEQEVMRNTPYNEEEKPERGNCISEPETYAEEEAAGEPVVEYAFLKNPNLVGKVRREGLEACVIKEADKGLNKTAIGRVCGCSPRTVYRILVEESNVERCSNCGRVLKDTEPGDICDYCGTEV